jgi:hypothetical protein
VSTTFKELRSSLHVYFNRHTKILRNKYTSTYGDIATEGGGGGSVPTEHESLDDIIDIFHQKITRNLVVWLS